MTVWAVEVTMLSDWHVGTGSGRPGDVDRLVRRDTNGLPYLPAKTLTGTWRDSCERAAVALDDGRSQGPWSEWVEVIFGTQAAHPGEAGGGWRPGGPRPASLSVRPARFGDQLGALLRSHPAVRDAVTVVRPGVRIDPESGRAMDKHLRKVEHARAGCTLITTATLADEAWTVDQRQAAHAVLACGLALWRRLGGKRRRGAGRCTVRLIDGPALPELVSFAREHPDPPDIPPWSSAKMLNLDRPVARAGPPDQAEPGHGAGYGDAGGWLETDLVVTLATPLCAPRVTTGNVVESHDRIPASMLLPALLRLIGRPEADAAARAGRLVVTDATIELDGHQAWALPRSLVHPKGDPDLPAGGTVDNAVAADPPPAKTHRRGYVVPPPRAGLPVLFGTPPRVVATHNVIADKLQRPTSEVGGVFSVQALAAGTIMRCQVRLDPSVAAVLAGDWPPAGPWTLALGRSKKDDYGEVAIVAADPRPRPRPMAHRDVLTVWALSDILLRDERLRPAADPSTLGAALGAALGVRLLVRRRDQGEGKGGAPLWAGAVDRHESWHQRWGYPRPTLVGLAAGTVVVYTVDGDLAAEALARVEASGIGERTAEGFGQVRFNDPLLDQPSVEGSRSEPRHAPQSQLLAVGDRDHTVARVIERAAWRAEIARAAEVAASDDDARHRCLGLGDNGPSASQLGALRAIIGRLLGPDDAPIVTGWLASIERVENRRGQWPDDARRLLRDLVSSEDTVWDVLEIEGATAGELCLTEDGEAALRRELWAKLCLTEDGEAALRREMWAEAVRSLVVRTVQHQSDAIRAVGG